MGRTRRLVRGRRRSDRPAGARRSEVHLPHRKRRRRASRRARRIAISDLDLASRLSFFLWSSIPDDTLLKLAEQASSASRGAADSRCAACSRTRAPSALTKNFAGQWLGLRELAGHAPVGRSVPRLRRQPAPGVPPRDRAAVRQPARRGPQRHRAAHGGLHVRERAPREALRHSGHSRQRVPARDSSDASSSARRGLLGKGALLTVSSQPGRTSPVIRGQWVLQEPARRAGAAIRRRTCPTLKAKTADAAGNTSRPSMREQMAQHRARSALRRAATS